MHQKRAVNVGQIASQIGQGALRAGKTLGGIPGDLGNVALTVGRRGLNVAGDLASSIGLNTMAHVPPLGRLLGMRGATGLAGLANLGDKTVGAAQKAVGRAAGVGRMSKFNPLNMAAGAGVLGGGAMALNRAAGGSAPVSVAAGAPIAQAGSSAAGGLGGFSQRAQQLWANLPPEARYAVGAGVPLALIGAFGGRKGLGALGLGVAGLGAAAGGAFGDDARRMVGKGLYNVGTFFGPGGSDPGSQLGMLSKLSPGLGATVLMGRDKTLSSEDAQKQYEFLTKNKEMISRMLPQLTGKSANALVGTVLLVEEEKAARCWKGYEPVPGSKAYSRGSCRPVGSKKTQKEMKKSSASAMFHHEKKELEPVFDDKKPSSDGTHVKVVRHELEDGVTMRPEEAKMTPDSRAVAD